MKVVIVLALLVACVDATGWPHYPSYEWVGLKRVGNSIVAAYSNVDRQRIVNRRAELVGASSGTAKYYDVPGTNRDFGYNRIGGRYSDPFGSYNDGHYGGYNDGGYGGYNDGRDGGYNDGHWSG